MYRQKTKTRFSFQSLSKHDLWYILIEFGSNYIKRELKMNFNDIVYIPAEFG